MSRALGGPRRRAGRRSFVKLVASACVVSGAWLAGGCASARPPPPRAPTLSAAADAVPPDLDLVVRVDLTRVRSALGPEGVAMLRKGASSALAADASSALFTRALEQCDAVLFAVRPELIPGEADNVLVLEGHFVGLEVDRTLRSSGWSAPVDLGGAVWRYDQPKSVSRASAARIYAFGEERLVFVSTAELDSVEAVVEQGRAPTTLRPKASGVLAFAARLRGLKAELGARYPLLSDALGDAAHVEGHVDSTDKGLSLEVAFELPSEAAAKASAQALSLLQAALASADGKMASIAQGARAQAVGSYVVLRIALERGIL